MKKEKVEAGLWTRDPCSLPLFDLTKRWGGEGGAASWGGGAVDDGYVNAFLAAALTRVMCAAVPIPAVALTSVLHSAAVGGSVAGDVGPL